MGVLFENKKLYKGGDIINGFKVITPNHSQDTPTVDIFQLMNVNIVKIHLIQLIQLLETDIKILVDVFSTSKGEVALYEFLKRFYQMRKLNKP